MLTRFTFYSCLIFIFFGIALPEKFKFHSNWGLISISNNFKNDEIESIISNHINYIDLNFPKIESDIINISIINNEQYKSSIWKWSLGVTIGKNTIILKHPSISHISSNRFNKVLKHELNHIYLNRLNRNVPRWFSEGFCLKFASEISISHSLNILKYLNDQSMFDIKILDEKFSNNNKRDFNFAYSASAIIINIIIHLYGENVIYKILDNLNQGLSFDDAFYNSTLVELDTFNNILYDEISNKYKC